MRKQMKRDLGNVPSCYPGEHIVNFYCDNKMILRAFSKRLYKFNIVPSIGEELEFDPADDNMKSYERKLYIVKNVRKLYLEDRIVSEVTLEEVKS